MNSRKAPPAVRVGSSACSVGVTSSGASWVVSGTGGAPDCCAAAGRPPVRSAAAASKSAGTSGLPRAILSWTLMSRSPPPAREGRKRYLAPSPSSSVSKGPAKARSDGATATLLALTGDERLQAALDDRAHRLGKTQSLQLARLVADRVDEGRHGALRHVADDAAAHRQPDVLWGGPHPVGVGQVAVRQIGRVVLQKVIARIETLLPEQPAQLLDRLAERLVARVGDQTYRLEQVPPRNPIAQIAQDRIDATGWLERPLLERRQEQPVVQAQDIGDRH